MIRLALRLSLAGLLSMACIPLFWLLLSAFEPYVLLYQARRIAEDRPYCIAVTDKGLQYKQVTKRGQLSYSRLVATVFYGGSGRYTVYAGTYYALLVLGEPNELKNWSKYSLDFDDADPMAGGLYRQDPWKFCPPVAGFSDRLR